MSTATQPGETTASLAADLYRQMNENLSEHLAGWDSRRLAEVFGCARLRVEEDQEAGKPLDLLRAFTEAVMDVDPAYSRPDPNDGPTDHLTLDEEVHAGRVLAESVGPVFHERR